MFLMKLKNKKIYKKILLLGSSRGLGKSIFNNIKYLSDEIYSFSSKDIDTSNLDSIDLFCKKHKSADIILLNSGGPPPKPFKSITDRDWLNYFKQLFLGYAKILKNIKINRNGYIFYISSSVIKEPDEFLVISSSLRAAFSSLLKSLSKEYSKKNISVINIAPGPFKTDRVKALVKNNFKDFEKKLPTGKIGNPDEIGQFVEFIISKKIKYLSGSTIYFDGNINKSFL